MKFSFFLLLLFILNHVVLAQTETWTNKLAGSYYTAVENTSYGVIVGEFDSRTYLQPYNGLLISKDVGNSWMGLGLNGRGITDIKQHNTILYATTYYQKNSLMGLFKTEDRGNNWQQLGPNVSSTCVETTGNTILLGTYSHGLWVSSNEGSNFIQKIGNGFFGPKILTIKANANKILVGTPGNTYISDDFGETWHTIQQLAGKQVSFITFTKNKIYVGTADIGGIFSSNDGGVNWNKLESFGTTSVGGLIFVESALYAGKYNQSTNKYSIYRSVDEGLTWTNTALDILANNPITKIDYIYATPSSLVASVSSKGIYFSNLFKYSALSNMFLRPPWPIQNTYELIDKIYSFFDHKYPLLAYSKHLEPTEEQTSTLNFLGEKGELPQMFYSSHSGIDFSLGYGTPVLAAANGIAEYYFCNGCGHTIKIDHLNGYQSIYQHLQSHDLITTTTPIQVSAGQTIGRVGMTGNTTGPHLHFEVITDSNTNGTLNDDYPYGRTDPFGWLENTYADPWSEYTWTDALGSHAGAVSKYLWTDTIPQLKTLVYPSTQNIINFQNKSFDLSALTDLTPFNFEYTTYSAPPLKNEPSNLKYVPNTSFILEFIDTVKNHITALPATIYATIALNQEVLLNTIEDSLRLYYFDSLTGKWNPLVSSYDRGSNTLTAAITHLSKFAVLGEAGDTTPPETNVTVSGDVARGWYIQHPIISFTNEADDLEKILYSLDNGNTWEEYTNPLELTNNGIVTILYRGVDTNGNIERAKSLVLKVNTQELPTKLIQIKQATFTIRSII